MAIEKPRIQPVNVALGGGLGFDSVEARLALYLPVDLSKRLTLRVGATAAWAVRQAFSEEQTANGARLDGQTERYEKKAGLRADLFARVGSWRVGPGVGFEYGFAQQREQVSLTSQTSNGGGTLHRSRAYIPGGRVFDQYAMISAQHAFDADATLEIGIKLVNSSGSMGPRPEPRGESTTTQIDSTGQMVTTSTQRYDGEAPLAPIAKAPFIPLLSQDILLQVSMLF